MLWGKLNVEKKSTHKSTFRVFGLGVVANAFKELFNLGKLPERGSPNLDGGRERAVLDLVVDGCLADREKFLYLGKP
jgi:hypothetical protein